MMQFAKQLRWQFVILAKNNLISISIAVTVLYGLIFYFIKDLGNVDKVLTLLIYNDPALIGLMFVGLSVIMEKNQSVLPALFVAPTNVHVYLITRILSLSIVGSLCALGMAWFGLGFNFHFLHFFFGVFGTCLLFSICGVLVVSFATDFLQFLLRSIPLLFLLSVPLLNYFELTDIRAFYFTPIQGCLNLVTQSYSDTMAIDQLVYGYASIAIWAPLLYIPVYRIFKSKIVKNL